MSRLSLLSLLFGSDESEDGEADLHQCGHCKEMFTSLSTYISHKIEKPCKAPSKNHNNVNETETEADEEMQEKGSPGASRRLKVKWLLHIINKSSVYTFRCRVVYCIFC